MIINTGSRTDTVQYYTEWLIKRFKEGFVYSRNPMFPNKVTRYELNPDVVDCVVFCSKNYEPILPYIKTITDKFNTYFYYTITAYGKDVEPNVPDIDKSIETLIKLSSIVGRQRIAWRYDPILLTEKYTKDYHLEKFEMMCEWLHRATTRCIVSFVDAYRNSPFQELEQEEIEELAEGLGKIAGKYQLPLYSCAEKLDLKRFGIRHGACIDGEKIREIAGYKLDARKDPGQRKECRCIESIDIGSYDTCINGCAYCYAVHSPASARKKYEQHDPASPLLVGRLRGDETITEKEIHSLRDNQLSLFD